MRPQSTRGQGGVRWVSGALVKTPLGILESPVAVAWAAALAQSLMTASWEHSHTLVGSKEVAQILGS